MHNCSLRSPPFYGWLIFIQATTLIEYAAAEVDMQLLGSVQLDNAATAITAAIQLRDDGFPALSDDAICAGLAAATLPGRFQVSVVCPPGNVKW